MMIEAQFPGIFITLMSDHHAPGLLDTIICLAKSTKRIKGLQAADTRVRS